VIGYAATTSGLIWRMASATQSAPVIAFLVSSGIFISNNILSIIISHYQSVLKFCLLFHDNCLERAFICADAASLAMLKVKAAKIRKLWIIVDADKPFARQARASCLDG
jgi:hypothetical protein